MSTDTITHEDLVTLTSFLADQGDTAKNIAYAVEKPHKFDNELATAKAVLNHEHENSEHRCLHDGDTWYCQGKGNGVPCDWTFDAESVG